jgi:hypothetical protein
MMGNFIDVKGKFCLNMLVLTFGKADDIAIAIAESKDHSPTVELAGWWGKDVCSALW